MQFKRRCLPNFEARSVMLFAACVLTTLGAHAQTAASPAQTSPPAVSQPAFGSGPGVQAGGSTTAEAAAFARADKDRDGKLSRSEAEQLPAVLQRFDQLDTNKDGFLSRDEFDKGMKS